LETALQANETSDNLKNIGSITLIPMEKKLPPLPAKRYFTIGEVGDLCDVKPHVLRYWEQEFTQLRPMKRRGNRRYYQHHEVLMIRKIRDLLYEQGFTISGARNKMQELLQFEREKNRSSNNSSNSNTNPPKETVFYPDTGTAPSTALTSQQAGSQADTPASSPPLPALDLILENPLAQIEQLRKELFEIRAMLA
jgi:DNA-binding transcriptional MerR regulator